MVDEIAPVNWGRQMDRLVTAAIILGAVTLGWLGGRSPATVVKVGSPQVINKVPVPSVTNEVPVPKVEATVNVPADVVKLKNETSLLLPDTMKVEVVKLPDLSMLPTRPTQAKAARKAPVKMKPTKKAPIKREGKDKGPGFEMPDQYGVKLPSPKSTRK